MTVTLQHNLVCLEDVEKTFLDTDKADLAKESSREVLIDTLNNRAEQIADRASFDYEYLGLNFKFARSETKDFFLNLLILQELALFKVKSSRLKEKEEGLFKPALLLSSPARVTYKILSEFDRVAKRYSTKLASLPTLTRELVEDKAVKSLYHKQLLGLGSGFTGHKTYLSSEVSLIRDEVFAGGAVVDYYLSVRYRYDDKWFVVRRYGKEEQVLLEHLNLEGVEEFCLSYFDNSAGGRFYVSRAVNYSIINKDDYLRIHFTEPSDYVKIWMDSEVAILARKYNKDKTTVTSTTNSNTLFRFGLSFGRKFSKLEKEIRYFKFGLNFGRAFR